MDSFSDPADLGAQGLPACYGGLKASWAFIFYATQALCSAASSKLVNAFGLGKLSLFQSNVVIERAQFG